MTDNTNDFDTEFIRFEDSIKKGASIDVADRFGEDTQEYEPSGGDWDFLR